MFKFLIIFCSFIFSGAHLTDNNELRRQYDNFQKTRNTIQFSNICSKFDIEILINYSRQRANRIFSNN